MPVNTAITLRKGTETVWSNTNPILASGEPGYDLTNKILKIGDGSTAWNSLTNHKHNATDIINFNSSVSGLLPVTNIVAGSNVTISQSGTVYTINSTASGTGSGTIDGTGTSNYITKWSDSDTITNSTIYDNGNIGIGTTSPVSKVDINGYNTINSQLKIGSLEIQPYALNNAWIGENVYFNGSNFVRRNYGSAGLFYFQGNEGQFRFSDNDSSGTSISNNPVWKILSDGSMGVGSGMDFTTGSLTNAKFKITNNGGVTVGTEQGSYVTSGIQKMQIVCGNNTTTNPLALIGGTAGIELWKNNTPTRAANIGLSVPGSAATDNIYISTYDGSSWDSRIIITNTDGYVGIGTQKPMAKLSITSGPFTDDGDSQILVLTSIAETVDNSDTQLYIDNISRKLVLPTDTVWNFTINISCLSSNSPDYGAGSFNFRGCIKNTGSISFVGSAIEENFIDSSLDGISVRIEANNTDDSLDIIVNGLNTQSIRWTAGIKLVQTSYSASSYFIPMKVNQTIP